MAVPTRKKNLKKPSGSRIAALVFLVLIVGAVSCYFLLSPARNTGVTPHKPNILHVKPALPVVAVPKTTIAESPAVSQPMHKYEHDYPSSVTITEPEKTAAGGGKSALLAIVIDDMGNSMSEARSLAAIKVPLTFAIIPGLRVDTEVAAYAAINKIQTMIHIPMQSKGWPALRLEANGLLVSMDAGELQERVSRFVQRLPGAVGANNHMGSEFTEREEKMGVVLQVLKNKNLFFIDSVTSPESTGLMVAQRLGIRFARRHVFLDNEQERNYIVGQLNQAVRLAKKNGSAIAICHPHPATIKTLAAALPELAAQGVSLVPASQLVK